MTSVNISGNTNDTNLVLDSASATITEGVSLVDATAAATTAGTAAGTAATEAALAKEAATLAATLAATAASLVETEELAAAVLAAKMAVLPVLDAPNSLHNDASGLVVKVTSELGNGRDIAFNKYGDIITVNDDKVVIVRMGSDYTDASFVALDVTQKRTLLSPEDILSWPTSWTKFGYGNYSIPNHSVVLRHYPADSITIGSLAVTKIFISTAFALFCWDYDDSTYYNAYNSKLINGRVLVNEITYGLDTKDDRYGYGGHVAHSLIFNQEGNLYISSGSKANLEADASNILTDERATVQYITDTNLKLLYNDPDKEPVSYIDASWVTLLARGIRNAAGLSLDASNNVWAVCMGFDSMEISGVTGIGADGEPLWNSNPADVLYKLDPANSGKKYGFPYSFISATELTVDGVSVAENNIVFIPSDPIPSFDAIGRPTGGFVNPYTKADIVGNDASFVQHASVIFPKSSSPIAAVFNQDDGNGNLSYDGRSDSRLVKTKSIPGEFGLVTLKGSWNKLRGSGGAGYKVVSFGLTDTSGQDFYNNPTFASGHDTYGGLDASGNLLGGFVASSVYRPTGIGLDKNGSVVGTSHYGWMAPPFRGGTLVTIYQPN